MAAALWHKMAVLMGAGLTRLCSAALLQAAAGCIVSAAYVKRGKPAPDVYLEALRRTGCSDASRALVVEDAVHGLNAARAAGAFAVAVTTSLPEDRLQGCADVVVAALAEVGDLLQSHVPALQASQQG